jgi:hypothetical protein
MTSPLARILAALSTWPADDLRRLVPVVELGPPSQLHAGVASADAIVDSRAPCTATTRLRADVLHAYREAGVLAGVPLPVPGDVTDKEGRRG